MYCIYHCVFFSYLECYPPSPSIVFTSSYGTPDRSSKWELFSDLSSQEHREYPSQCYLSFQFQGLYKSWHFIELLHCCKWFQIYTSILRNNKLNVFFSTTKSSTTILLLMCPNDDIWQCLAKPMDLFHGVITLLTVGCVTKLHWVLN